MSYREFSILGFALVVILFVHTMHSFDERTFRDEVREYMREQRECP